METDKIFFSRVYRRPFLVKDRRADSPYFPGLLSLFFAHVRNFLFRIVTLFIYFWKRSRHFIYFYLFFLYRAQFYVLIFPFPSLRKERFALGDFILCLCLLFPSRFFASPPFPFASLFQVPDVSSSLFILIDFVSWSSGPASRHLFVSSSFYFLFLAPLSCIGSTFFILYCPHPRFFCFPRPFLSFLRLPNLFAFLLVRLIPPTPPHHPFLPP